MCRFKIVIFYCISRSKNMNILKCRNCLKSVYLYIHRKRRRKSIKIIFCAFFTLRFQKQRMCLFVRKVIIFCFNAGTISWSYTFDLSVIKRSLLYHFSKHYVPLFRLCLKGNMVIALSFLVRSLDKKTYENRNLHFEFQLGLNQHCVCLFLQVFLFSYAKLVNPIEVLSCKAGTCGF